MKIISFTVSPREMSTLGLDEISLRRWVKNPLININSTNNPNFPKLA